MQELMSSQNDLDAVNAWKTKALIVGAGMGLLVGVGAAYLLVQRAEKEGQPPTISAGEGVRLGVIVFGLLRQVSQL